MLLCVEKVDISNMHRTTPLHKIHSITDERILRNGIHAFDHHIGESVCDLTCTRPSAMAAWGIQEWRRTAG